MSRLVRILLSCAVTLAGAALAAESRWGTVARLLGQETFAFRNEMLAQIAGRPQGDGALVAWLGDSTLISVRDVRAYPLLVADRLPGVTSWIVCANGLNAYGYWALAEPVLQARPRAVVLVENLRVRGDGGRSPEDLLDLVPAREQLRGALLPLEARGITRLRLALASVVERPLVERVRATLDGLRNGYREVLPWMRVPTDAPPVFGILRFVGRTALTLHAYDLPLRERSPDVVMLGAAVGRFVRAGIPVLVVVTPIPMEALRGSGWYDAERFRARIGRIRAVVERAGGQLLDLHDELERYEFQDAGGHATPFGHARLASRVRPALKRLLADGTP